MEFELPRDLASRNQCKRWLRDLIGAADRGQLWTTDCEAWMAVQAPYTVEPWEVAVEKVTKNRKYSAIVDYGQLLPSLSVAMSSYLGDYGTLSRVASAAWRIYGRRASDTSAGRSHTPISTALQGIHLQNAKETVVVAWANGLFDYHALVRVLSGNTNIKIKAMELDMRITQVNALEMVRMMTRQKPFPSYTLKSVYHTLYPDTPIELFHRAAIDKFALAQVIRKLVAELGDLLE